MTLLVFVWLYNLYEDFSPLWRIESWSWRKFKLKKKESLSIVCLSNKGGKCRMVFNKNSPILTSRCLNIFPLYPWQKWRPSYFLRLHICDGTTVEESCNNPLSPPSAFIPYLRLGLYVDSGPSLWAVSFNIAGHDKKKP